MEFLCFHLLQWPLSSSRPLNRMTPTGVCSCPSLRYITLGHKCLLLPHLRAPSRVPRPRLRSHGQLDHLGLRILPTPQTPAPTTSPFPPPPSHATLPVHLATAHPSSSFCLQGAQVCAFSPGPCHGPHSPPFHLCLNCGNSCPACLISLHPHVPCVIIRCVLQSASHSCSVPMGQGRPSESSVTCPQKRISAEIL